MFDPPNQNPPSSAANSATSNSTNGANTSSTAKAKEAAPKQNPALRMLGIPNWRPKLPSRNWLIFLTITTSFTCAIFYDRHYKKKNQEKWARLVSNLQKDPLSTKQMPRRLTVYLAAPPGDGLRVAREHFHEYVRPVLEKGGVDWDVVEGRREGDVRAGTAERIRRRRRKLEGTMVDEADQEDWGKEEADKEEAIRVVRELNGVQEYEGVGGDVVIGRHVWKEYIRGIHEGWLGPLTRPREAAEEESEAQPTTLDSSKATGDIWQTASASEATLTTTPSLENLSDPPSIASSSSDDDASPTIQSSSPDEPHTDETKPVEPEPSSDAEQKPKRPIPPEPYLPPSAYASASAPHNLPDTLGPAATIPYPHILGFLNTRIRVWRFLNQRKLADQIGRDVAAAVFASSRPFRGSSFSSSTTEPWNAPPPDGTSEGESKEEAKECLEWEERDWPKSVRKEWEKRWGEDEEKGVKRGESVWLDEVMLDERIAGRMRRFVLDVAEEDRARRIASGQEKVSEQGEEEK